MKFGEILRQARPELVVSPRHEAWLQLNSDPIYSPEALAFGAKELLKQASPRDRRGTVSGSSLGGCIRQQQFTFLGLPNAPWTSKQVNKIQNGVFVHLRWQMAGLTEGWLDRAEVPVPRGNQLSLSGTMDGIAYEGSTVEFKSINSNGFSGVLTFGAKEDHVLQLGTYMRLSDSARGTLIYECKNTQDYVELIMERTDELDKKVEDRADEVWTPIANKELVEPLSKCIDRKGWRYDYCPFRNNCLKVKTWAQAEEIAHG